MPGTIVRALRDAGTRNPVFMIDEIDKMGADFRGDPAERDARGARPGAERLASATTTSTSTSTSPRSCSSPRRTCSSRSRRRCCDRMEVIQLAGYTVDEKLHIAKRYLVPRQLAENGLKASQIDVRRRGAAGDHRGVHARGRRPQPRARDRHGLPQARPRGRRGQARRPRRQADVSAKRVRELLGRRRSSPRRGGGPSDPGRRHRPRLDAGRRRRRKSPTRSSHPHYPPDLRLRAE